MNYERERYMRMQEAEHDMIRMRDPRYDVRKTFRQPLPIPPTEAKGRGDGV